MLTWTRLAVMGRSRIIQTSPIWLFLVPAAVKLTGGATGEFVIGVGGNPLTLDLALPFTWTLLYFAALFLSMATLIYALKCPRLIKRFPEYNRFKESDLGIVFLADTWLDHGNLDGFFAAGGRAAEYAQAASRAFDLDAEREQVRAFAVAEDERVRTGELRSSAPYYWKVRERLDTARPGWLMACAVTGAIGLILFGVTLFENFVYVWNMAFPSMTLPLAP